MARCRNVAVTLGEFPSKEERASVNKPNSGQQPPRRDGRESYAGHGPAIEAPGHDQRCGGGPGGPGQPRRRCRFAARRCDPAGEPSIGHQCEGYSQAVSTSKKDDSVLLLVDRGGNTMFLAV